MEEGMGEGVLPFLRWLISKRGAGWDTQALLQKPGRFLPMEVGVKALGSGSEVVLLGACVPCLTQGW